MGDSKEQVTSEKVMQKIRERAKQPLALTFPALFQQPHTVTTKLAIGVRDETHYRAHSKSEPEPIEKLLNFTFGHSAANPSYKLNCEIHHETYVYPRQETISHLDRTRLPEVPVVNYSLAESKLFLLNTVASAARRRQKLYKKTSRLHGNPQTTHQLDLVDPSTAQINDSKLKHIILGDRGAGKTVFLNHLLTTNSSALDDLRTIWFRIDLTKQKAGTVSIKEWIKWKIIKVLYSYYDQEKFFRHQIAFEERTTIPDEELVHENQSWNRKVAADMVFDFSGSNLELIDEARLLSPSRSADEIRKDIIDFESVGNTGLSGNPEKLTPSYIVDTIINYIVRRKDVALIIVIDGLDQLGLDEQSKGDFSKIVSELRSYLVAEHILPAAHLITMRYSTFFEYLTNDNLRQHASVVRLAVVPSVEIYKSKVAFAEKKMEEASYTGLKLKTLEYVCNAFMSFVAISFRDRPITDDLDFPSHELVELGFETLENLYGPNRRKLFQTLQKALDFMFNCFPQKFVDMLISASYAAEHETPQKIEDGIEVRRYFAKISYRLIEAFMLGDKHATHRKERYVVALKQLGTATSLQARPWVDSRNSLLFNFFYFPSSETPINPHNLLPVRLLTCLGDRDHPIAKDNLVNLVCTIWGYNEPLTKFVLSELLESGAIAYWDEQHMLHESEIYATPQARYNLENVVPAIEYISLALQTSALPRRLCSSELIQVRSYKSSEYVIKNKILTSINFIRYITYIEENEKKLFARFVGDHEAAHPSWMKEYVSELDSDRFWIGNRLQQFTIPEIEKILEVMQIDQRNQCFEVISDDKYFVMR